MMLMEKIYQTAIKAAIEGGKEILKIYHMMKLKWNVKGIIPPLTLADRAANAKIIQLLEKTNYPIIMAKTEFLYFLNIKLLKMVLDVPKE